MITIHPDHCAEISEVETAKIHSRKILGKAKIGKIDTRAEKKIDLAKVDGKLEWEFKKIYEIFARLIVQ